jgi:hypothetical protein
VEALWRQNRTDVGRVSLTMPLDGDGRVTTVEGMGPPNVHTQCVEDVLVGAQFPYRNGNIRGAEVHLFVGWNPTPGQPISELESPSHLRTRRTSLHDWWSVVRSGEPLTPEQRVSVLLEGDRQEIRGPRPPPRPEADFVDLSEAHLDDSVKLLAPLTDDLGYARALVMTFVSLPREASDLVLVLIADGTPVVTGRVRATGPLQGRVVFGLHESPELDEALRVDSTRFELTLGLERDGDEVGPSVRVPVHLGRRLPCNGPVLQMYEVRPNEVLLEVDKHTLDTHRWWIDWGDGTTESGGVDGGPNDRFASPRPVGHLYTEPGKYEVSFRYDTYPGGSIDRRVFIGAP